MCKHKKENFLDLFAGLQNRIDDMFVVLLMCAKNWVHWTSPRSLLLYSFCSTVMSGNYGT